MRKLTYTGPLDTLELHDGEGKTVFSEHLHPGRTYKLPDDGHPVLETMISRQLFVDPKAETVPEPAETAASPGIDTSPGVPAPAIVAETAAGPATKPKK